MRSLHSAKELKIDTDPYKLIKKISPRNTDNKKIFTNSPTFKSTSTNSNKKLTRDTKKLSDPPLVSRVLPSRSEKILFESSNKLTYKLTKQTPKVFEK